MNISLLCEHYKKQRLIKSLLGQHCVRVCASAHDLSSCDPDVILVFMPYRTFQDHTVCAHIRTYSTAPLCIVLPSGILKEWRASYFDYGADACVPENINTKEFCLRLQRLGEKSKIVRFATNGLVVGDVSLNWETMEVRKKNTPVHIRAIEYRLLRYMFLRPHHVIKRRDLAMQIWKFPFAKKKNVLDVYMYNLRKKFGNIIECIPKIGFRVRETSERVFGNPISSGISAFQPRRGTKTKAYQGTDTPRRSDEAAAEMLYQCPKKPIRKYKIVIGRVL